MGYISCNIIVVKSIAKKCQQQFYGNRYTKHVEICREKAVAVSASLCKLESVFVFKLISFIVDETTTISGNRILIMFPFLISFL